MLQQLPEALCFAKVISAPAEVGEMMENLVAATAHGVQVGYRDEPLPLVGCAALGQVPREGCLCPWGRFGARLAKLRYMVVVDVGLETSKDHFHHHLSCAWPLPWCPAWLLELQLGWAG